MGDRIITVFFHSTPEYDWLHDTIKCTIHENGDYESRRYHEGDVDIFTMRPYLTRGKYDRISALLDSLKTEPFDGSMECILSDGDGQETVAHIPKQPLTQSMEGFLYSDFRSSGEVDEGFLEDMFMRGNISFESYRDQLEENKRFRERKIVFENRMGDGSYPFVSSDEDIAEDYRHSLITDEQYDMFVWYRRNRVEDCGPGTDKSFKLKLSSTGLRIMGRYDLCEYHLTKDSTEMTKRLYCFTGSIFEGCGNVKAPDDASHIQLTEERHAFIFRYLNEIKHMGLLGGDYRESPFSNYFFDLYTRYEDSPMIHSKGTAKYPYFIRMLMYLIGAEDISE